MGRMSQSTFNSLISAVSGIIFGVGWFIFIDGVVYGHSRGGLTVPWFFYFPGFVSSVALIMVNIVSIDQLNPFFMFSEGMSNRVRFWLLFWFFVAFASVGFAIWEFTWYQDNVKKNEATLKSTTTYPGISVMVQTMVILLSTLIFLFASKKSEDGEQSLI